MNQNITLSTRKKINQLTLFYFRLLNKPEGSFAILYNIFTKEDYISDNCQLFFENQIKRNRLKLLAKSNLITKDYKITTLGITVILSHKLSISILSVFILSKLYNAQTTIRDDMAFPYPILVQWFESFPSVEHIRVNLSDMRQNGIIDNNSQYSLVRININKLIELKKYDKHLKVISQYVDETSEKIDDLISADPLVIKQRTQNLKLLAGMNFA